MCLSFLWQEMPLIHCIFVFYMMMRRFYRYTGIRISTRRLESFLAGKADLRLLYLQPENEHEYYDVVFQSGEYQKTLLKESVLLEDKLPAEGYVLSGEKRENVVINLPIKDRSLLAELVRKFGWACM